MFPKVSLNGILLSMAAGAEQMSGGKVVKFKRFLFLIDDHLFIVNC